MVYLEKIFAQLAGVVYPSYCVACRALTYFGELGCHNCCALVRPLASVTLHITAKHSVTVHALGAYEGLLKSLVISKFSYDMSGYRYIAALMAQQHVIKTGVYDLFVPVPLHWRRFAQRGFNQADCIAQKLSGYTGIPTLSLIKRVKNTGFQSQQPTGNRATNVAYSFAPASRYTNLKAVIAGKHIVIVDDLMTTGSTLREMARSLLPGQPASITAFVAARTS